MKKISTLIFVSLVYLSAYSQLMQASIGMGSQANRVKIYLKSDVSQSPSSISTLQFNLAIDTTGLLVAPTASVISSAFTGSVWPDPVPYKEGGFWNYNIYTTASPLTPTFTANAEFEAMEIQFLNGVPNMANVALATLPEGGATGFALFYCTGTVNSNGLSNLYYARAGATVNNQNSYDPTQATTGTATSTVFIPNIVLPVKFLGFDAIKKDNNAVLTWRVENEGPLTDRYEIERSTNGSDFKQFATVTPKNNGRSSNSYELNDLNLTTIRSSGVIYYRIKQIDKEGHVANTDIKSVRLNSKALILNVFPNPVKNFAKVTVDLEQDANGIITINDASGKQVQVIQMKLFKGFNTKDINMASFASGSYLLKVQTEKETKTIPVVKTN